MEDNIDKKKSKEEIKILQYAKNITLSVQYSAARILREGISSAEVTSFIHAAHKRKGAPDGSYFCIVFSLSIHSQKTILFWIIKYVETGIFNL